MSVLRRPIVTEKFTALNEKGVYGFEVAKNANKIEIKNDIEKLYGVNVEKVRTVVVPGKVKTRYTKSRILSGKTQSYKKAIVTLAQGELIDFYSGI
jgi:large subunit ribosomal protein L23